jgi:general secretion pathway protein A
LIPLYGAWFGLQREPFSIAPDPRTLFMSERHREALAHLLYGVQGGGGFVLLTGEIGAGKTTVSRCFLEQVPEGCRVAYVFNPKQTVDELLWTVAQEFGLEAPGQAGSGGAGGGSKALVDALNRYLLQVHAQGSQAVLVIDEAQALSAEVLEQLRLLTNLETSERKLLQIILIGQPELRAMVASPGLEQLAQRVIARYHLGPLSAPDTARYVQHRLAVAGLSGPLPFDAAALKRVHERSRGVPRRINLLCDRALLGAYATGRRSVDAGIVERAAAEVDGEPLPASAGWWGAPGSLRRTAWLAAAGLVLTLGAAALASALMRQT